MALGAELLNTIIAYRSPLLTETAVNITVFGSVTFAALLILAAWLFGKREAAWQLLLGAAFSGTAAYIGKQAVSRARPMESLLPYAQTSSAFPSGHATLAFALATVLTMRYGGRRFGAFLYLVATGVAVSRVYLGVHFPGDVLAGAVLGVAAGWFAAEYYAVFREYGRAVRTLLNV